MTKKIQYIKQRIVWFDFCLLLEYLKSFQLGKVCNKSIDLYFISTFVGHTNWSPKWQRVELKSKSRTSWICRKIVGELMWNSNHLSKSGFAINDLQSKMATCCYLVGNDHFYPTMWLVATFHLMLLSFLVSAQTSELVKCESKFNPTCLI